MTEDPRQARTREALTSALVRLLRSAPLDTITVSELCREAGVHRTTFYGHAEGVHQFAVTTFSRDLDDLSSVAPASHDPAAIARQYVDALRVTLAHVAGERGVYRSLFASSSRGAFRSALEDRLRHRATLALRTFAEHDVAGAPRTLREQLEAAAFIAGALVGVIDVWAREDDTDTDAAATRVLHLMPPWWPLHD